ncbi:MAG: prolipoprotein diacylglyceryl transferase family protein [Thermoleophilia bacterium]
MHPYLFSWGPFLVHSYGVTMSLGFLAAGLVTFYGFKRRGLDTEPIIWLVAIAALGGVIGALALTWIFLSVKKIPKGKAFDAAGRIGSAVAAL